MNLLVCYDVETTTKEGRRRLRQVAKLCESHGQRAQKSVFECRMNKALFLQFEAQLLRLIDHKSDNLRIYHLDQDSKINSYGIAHIIDFEEPLIL